MVRRRAGHDLTVADHPAMIAYALAVYEHERLARRIATRKSPAPAALVRQWRSLAGELRVARKDLGLPAYDRARITLPPSLPDEPQSEFMKFDVVMSDGTRIRHVPPGKRRSTAQAS
jgi:hypothetical protein